MKLQLSQIDYMCTLLLKNSLDKNLPQLFKVISKLESLPEMREWVHRISWGVRNGDSVFIRDCLFYGVKPVLDKMK